MNEWSQSMIVCSVCNLNLTILDCAVFDCNWNQNYVTILYFSYVQLIVHLLCSLLLFEKTNNNNNNMKTTKEKNKQQCSHEFHSVCIWLFIFIIITIIFVVI